MGPQSGCIPCTSRRSSAVSMTASSNGMGAGRPDTCKALTLCCKTTGTEHSPWCLKADVGLCLVVNKTMLPLPLPKRCADQGRPFHVLLSCTSFHRVLGVRKRESVLYSNHAQGTGPLRQPCCSLIGTQSAGFVAIVKLDRHIQCAWSGAKQQSPRPTNLQNKPRCRTGLQLCLVLHDLARDSPVCLIHSPN